MVDQSWPVNSRRHYVVLTVTSSGCLKLYVNPWELNLEDWDTAIEHCKTGSCSCAPVNMNLQAPHAGRFRDSDNLCQTPHPHLHLWQNPLCFSTSGVVISLILYVRSIPGSEHHCYNPPLGGMSESCQNPPPLGIHTDSYIEHNEE